MRYFLDTEFDGFGGPLISLALVPEDFAGVTGSNDAARGSRLGIYIVLRTEASDPWVQANVIPILEAEFSSFIPDKQRAGERIARYLSADPAPVIVSDWPADIRYFCELIEFPRGNMAAIPGLTFELHRVDAYPTTLTDCVQHNAFDDARALRQYFLDRERAAA